MDRKEKDMRYLKERIENIYRELKRLSCVQRIKVEKWEYKKGKFFYPEDAKKAEEEFLPFDSGKDHWYGRDEHYWFRAQFTVPESFDGKSLWFQIKTQIAEWDDGRNPQFLIFLDGEPIQGLDMNHKEVKITENAQKGRVYTIELQAYTGILHSEFNLFVDAIEINEKIKKLYYDIKVPIKAFDRMEKEDPNRLALQNILNETINLLDLRTPYSEEFWASVDRAQSYIDKALYEDMTGYEDVIATCIGHTHIDVAWWWTVEQTREKVGRSFATVLKLMEEYPNYKFMSSQPQLYVFLKKRYPDLYARLKERVKEGRWEPEGGMWVEADCNLTSGESLVRQFIHGKKFFKEEFGVENRILWLPDVFGYSGALPQIMKKCGIDYFMTTKLSWNQINEIPYDTMMWRGIDGTEVLTHLITTAGIKQPEKSFFTTYNGMLHPDAIIGGWKRYQNKDINHDILISYGYGDGGGGPTRDMLETSIRMEKGIKGIPKVRQEFAGKYFEELEERVKGNTRLPIWEGEFYFEYHRGTYTSMARNKRSNRKSELMMMDLEFLNVLAMEKSPYEADKMYEMWETILINQFHDILPGSSIQEVYEVTKKEYEELEAQGKKMLEEKLSQLVEQDNYITVFNTTGFERDDKIVLEESVSGSLKDKEGNCYPIEAEEGKAVAYVKGIPSKGSKVFEIVSDCYQEEVFNVKEKTIETPFYYVTFHENGQISRLFDKENRREVFKENSIGNAFLVYEDKPMYYDSWDVDMYYTEKFYPVEKLTEFSIKTGSLSVTVTMEYEFNQSKINQKIYFYKDTKRIDFETVVDWKEHQHLMKAHFPFDVHTDEATFEIQFGNVKRKVHSNTSWEEARFESCAQKWMDISEGHYGISVLNDCKYGHSVKDGCVGLTLIKSGIEPNRTADQEIHKFTYALYPHSGSWNSDTVREAYKLNMPLYARIGKGEEGSFVSVDKENVMIETVKLAEAKDGIIVRAYDFENAREEATFTFQKEIQKVFSCNLLENEEEELAVEGAYQVKALIKPYEIKTLKILFKN